MNTVLFVDDEPNVLDGIRRQLRKHFDIVTAPSGEEGLRVLEEHGSIALIVSDMKMPGMAGPEFLAHAREQSPDSVRMILSGQAELASTIAVVNEGHLFRFLTKPCTTEVLIAGVQAGLDQYRLVVAEREVLEETLSGAVQLLTEILAMVNPEAFSKAARVQRYAESVAEILDFPGAWEIRLAAMLSQIGCLAIPEEILKKIDADQPTSEAEKELFATHPSVGGQFLAKIPRLEGVAEIVTRQMESVEASSFSAGIGESEVRAAGGQILRAAIEFDGHISRGLTHGEAFGELKRSTDPLPRAILAALSKLKIQDVEETKAVTTAELRPGMILDEDVKSTTGVLLVAAGQEVTEAMQVRLQGFAQNSGVVEPIRVRLRPSSAEDLDPAEDASEDPAEGSAEGSAEDHALTH